MAHHLYTNCKKVLISLEENLYDTVKKVAKNRTWPMTTWIQEAIREKLEREHPNGSLEFEKENPWLKHPGDRESIGWRPALTRSYFDDDFRKGFA